MLQGLSKNLGRAVCVSVASSLDKSIVFQSLDVDHEFTSKTTKALSISQTSRQAVGGFVCLTMQSMSLSFHTHQASMKVISCEVLV